LVLNEYVHGPSRVDFLQSLKDRGLQHIKYSERIGINNQILIASRDPFMPGNLSAPEMRDGISESNWLHLSLNPIGLDVVGVRVPAYRTSKDLRAYWEKFTGLVQASASRRVLFIGDLNADPDSETHLGSTYLKRLRSENWAIPSPKGPWSFASGSRIDHVIASPGIIINSATYLSVLEGVTLASKPIAESVSDHAALVVDLNLR